MADDLAAMGFTSFGKKTKPKQAPAMNKRAIDVAESPTSKKAKTGLGPFEANPQLLLQRRPRGRRKAVVPQLCLSSRKHLSQMQKLPNVCKPWLGAFP